MSDDPRAAWAREEWRRFEADRAADRRDDRRMRVAACTAVVAVPVLVLGAVFLGLLIRSFR